jgi:Phosphotransferase enzyme family
MSSPAGAAPDRALVDRVHQVVGSHPVAWEPVTRGWTAAERWVVRLADGGSIFVKAAADEASADWLRTEHHNYEEIGGPWMPAMTGWEELDGPFPVLILEDLSHALWPPPWSPDQIDRVLQTLTAIHGTDPPRSTPTMESLMGSDLRQGWAEVLDDPRPFLTLGLCSHRWLDDALPELLALVQDVDLSGDQLLHGDVRSDNICFDGNRTLLVDWNWACVGNGKVDLAAWLPSLHDEGGPEPWTLLPGEAEIVTALAGYWAWKAGLEPPWPGSQVREIQLSQLKVALPWAARELDLPPPD